jgi:hypothetical protein
MRLTVKVDLDLQGAAAPLHFETSSLTDVGEPHAEPWFSGGLYQVRRIHVEVLDSNVAADNPAKIHNRELRFNP